MEHKKPYQLLTSFPLKLNNFYKKKLHSKIKVRNKSKIAKNFDPVTNYDKNFEIFIRSAIAKKFPKHSIVGEEFKAKKTFNDYEWAIDPIDGTRAFYFGIPTWSNLIGLSYKNKPIFGLANFPELKKYYVNDKKKSYVFSGSKKIILKSTRNKDLKKIKVISRFNQKFSPKKQDKFLKKINISNNSFVGFDALNYCLLAEGMLDVVIEVGLKPFDILPLIPIINNAGAIVTNWKNGSAKYGGNILATSNKELHSKMLKILNKF
tara:strand:+ start:460 stop:1248 length:789 start_codon:yes stop_codon:yes gene_type:complete